MYGHTPHQTHQSVHETLASKLNERLSWPNSSSSSDNSAIGVDDVISATISAGSATSYARFTMRSAVERKNTMCLPAKTHKRIVKSTLVSLLSLQRQVYFCFHSSHHTSLSSLDKAIELNLAGTAQMVLLILHSILRSLVELVGFLHTVFWTNCWHSNSPRAVVRWS